MPGRWRREHPIFVCRPGRHERRCFHGGRQCPTNWTDGRTEADTLLSTSAAGPPTIVPCRRPSMLSGAIIAYAVTYACHRRPAAAGLACGPESGKITAVLASDRRAITFSCAQCYPIVPTGPSAAAGAPGTARTRRDCLMVAYARRKLLGRDRRASITAAPVVCAAPFSVAGTR